MRKVICAFNISIDGCYDHTKPTGGDEILNYFTDIMRHVDVSVSGRKMYELMQPYWTEVQKAQSGTEAGNQFAETINHIQSIVVSRTMAEADGGPIIWRNDIEAKLLALKQTPGKKIAVGGMTLRSQLMAKGLIDELYVVVHPILAGSGPRFMEDVLLTDTIKMELADVKVIQGNCVAMHYLKTS